MHNSLELSFTNIWGLRSNFVDCEFFLDSNSPDILALCETNLDDSVDSGNFSVRGYLALISNDSSSHAWFCSLCKRRTSFARDWSLGLSRFLFSIGFASLSVLLLFLYWSPWTQFLILLILSNIDKVLLINPSANVFVFGDFHINHKEWLPYSGGNDISGELSYNFSISNDLTQMIKFSTWISSCDSQSYSFGFSSFFWCYYLFYNRFPSIGKFWSCCCLSFH